MKEKLIEEILKIEWEYFTNANNSGGRADCQDNYEEFEIMRKSQWQTMSEKILVSYLNDLKECKNKKINIVVEKYARMMKFNAPDEYEKIKHHLDEISKEKYELVEKIVEIYINWEIETAKKYFNVCGKGRPLYSKEDTKEITSIETYLRGELYSYSENTLRYYYEYILECNLKNKNLAEENIENILIKKGYKSIEEAEKLISQKY